MGLFKHGLAKRGQHSPRTMTNPVSSQGLVELVSRMRSDLAQYDFLLPGDYVPEPPLRKRWFRWRPSFEITQDMIVWAGDIARARVLMDLQCVIDAFDGRCLKCGGLHAGMAGDCVGPPLPSKPHPHAGRMMG